MCINSRARITRKYKNTLRTASRIIYEKLLADGNGCDIDERNEYAGRGYAAIVMAFVRSANVNHIMVGCNNSDCYMTVL